MRYRSPLLLAAVIAITAAGPALAQRYANRLNRPFATVSTGPMHASIIDVAADDNAVAVRLAAIRAVRLVRPARERAIERGLAAMRIRRTAGPAYVDIVIARRGGRLAMPAAVTRAAGEITFSFPAAGSPGSWTAAMQSDINAILSATYGEMKAVYGLPAWAGAITVVNGDTLPAGQLISDPKALSGGIWSVSTSEFILPQNRSVQSMVLNVVQMLAIVFRGPATLSYDAWERGMARAATLATLRGALPTLSGIPSQSMGGTLGDLTLADPLWHALDRYDFLNQPPLGNDRFCPVSRELADAGTAAFPSMLVPRLQMAGSAWLKVLTEDPSFLRTFNGLYYTARAANPSVAGDVPALVQLADQALKADGAALVEGLGFPEWYQRQYVLDTSVSQGSKLYVQVSALRPQLPTDEDFAIAAILIYYRTAFDALGNSDEVNLAGTCYPIYWDFEFLSRLYLGAQYERAEVVDGVGTVAPTFFATIGGDAALEGRMRVALQFPLNAESVRVYFPPRSVGKVGAPNALWGVVTGADTGTVQIDADGLTSAALPVKQGAFGGDPTPVTFDRPRRATVTFTDAAGAKTVRRMVVGYGEAGIVIDAVSSIGTKTHTFAGGVTMVSFPVRPIQSRAADALLSAATGLPLFNEGSLLMATWLQSLPGDSKYQLYPSFSSLRPGLGYWASFDSNTQVKLIGAIPGAEPQNTANLIHGWNQIGNPYDTALDISALQFQYMADNVTVPLATAISRGWIVAQTTPGGQVAVWDYDPVQGYIAAASLQPWKGYWIRVLVTEGLAITYPNPASRAARITRSAPVGVAMDGWALRLSARTAAGASNVVFGQSSRASQGYDAGIDGASPPNGPGAAPQSAIVHADWPAAGTDYGVDIRPQGRSSWDVIIRTPEPNVETTLTWRAMGAAPRGVRIAMTDTASGRTVVYGDGSSLTFRPQAATRAVRITAEPRTRAALRIGSLDVRASGAGRASGAVAIGYDLTAEAAVSAAIIGQDGRVIRHLVAGRAAAAGVGTLVWDSRDDRAVSVPSGVYIVQLSARSLEGDVVRAIRPITVVR